LTGPGSDAGTDFLEEGMAGLVIVKEDDGTQILLDTGRPSHGSPRREPWESSAGRGSPGRGERSPSQPWLISGAQGLTYAPAGLACGLTGSRGLTPWAMVWRPCGALTCATSERRPSCSAASKSGSGHLGAVEYVETPGAGAPQGRKLVDGMRRPVPLRDAISSH